MKHMLLLLHCDIEAFIWSCFMHTCGLAWCFPGCLQELLEAWRLGLFHGYCILPSSHSICYPLVHLRNKERLGSLGTLKGGQLGFD